jgi:hypothetical protein
MRYAGPKMTVIPRWSRGCGGMRGTHEHRASKVFMGGPDKPGHDRKDEWRRAGRSIA